MTHLIDHYALYPHGYRESVQQATNLIVDPVVKALYADLRVITRTPQSNASPARLRTIVTLPLVVATHGFDREKLVLDSP